MNVGVILCLIGAIIYLFSLKVKFKEIKTKKKNHKESLKCGIKYNAISIIGSLFFMLGIVLLII